VIKLVKPELYRRSRLEKEEEFLFILKNKGSYNKKLLDKNQQEHLRKTDNKKIDNLPHERYPS